MTLNQFLQKWPPKTKKVTLCFCPSYESKKMSIEKAVKKYGDSMYSCCWDNPTTIVVLRRR